MHDILSKMAENTPKNSIDGARESDATYDHVIKYTGLFGGVQGIMMLVSVVRNKIVSELLGPSGLAIINLFNNYLANFSVVIYALMIDSEFVTITHIDSFICGEGRFIIENQMDITSDCYAFIKCDVCIYGIPAICKLSNTCVQQCDPVFGN